MDSIKIDSIKTKRIAGGRLIAFGGLVVGLILLATALQGLLSNPVLSVNNAWARPAGAGDTGAVYLTIDNGTAASERLVSASSSIADSVELHQTVVQNDIARMIPVAGLDIPAGGSVQIAPDGYHFMLINLHQALTSGATFPITLQFASGKQIPVTVQIQMNPPN